MTAPSIGCSGLTSIGICFVLMTITAGCSGTGVIDPNQAAIEPNSSIVAFSVNTSKLSEYATTIRPVRLQIQYGSELVTIRLGAGKTGIQRILLEVPATAALFSQLDLAVGTGIFSDHYLTIPGQTVKLTQGEITYLGRIEIEDIKFEQNADGSVGKPIAVMLVFADALEDDQIAWEQQYELFQNHVPNQQIVGNWAGRDYVDLRIKEWSFTYASDGTRRPVDSSTRETRRGPRPESRPRNSSSPH